MLFSLKIGAAVGWKHAAIDKVLPNLHSTSVPMVIMNDSFTGPLGTSPPITAHLYSVNLASSRQWIFYPYLLPFDFFIKLNFSSSTIYVAPSYPPREYNFFIIKWETCTIASKLN